MRLIATFLTGLLLHGSATAQVSVAARSAMAVFLKDTAIRKAHAGVAFYDPATKKFLYTHQAEKLFVPASNVKIVTCYAAMKYLKHILPGVRYYENDTAVYIIPTGDPTLLHRDFENQPVIDFLQQQTKKVYITDRNWRTPELGKGWSWDDYSDEYMTERSPLPVYGNTIRWVQEKLRSRMVGTEESFSIYSDPEVDWKVSFEPDPLEKEFEVKRNRLENAFVITEGTENQEEVFVPFITGGLTAALELLRDTVNKEISILDNFLLTNPERHVVPSQPVDSVLRPMMYRSDNFFAEQLLLMVGEERTGILDADMVIDSLLKTDLSDLPQAPSWVDGSGLSRYNLFSPADFITILDSMRIQFGIERLKMIFPPGDSGTLKGYYLNGRDRRGSNEHFIYAKTGSMSGVVALSGFLYTRNNRLLIFSVLVNNFTAKTAHVRRAVERMILRVREER